MPALRFKTCRLLSGNVWKRKLTIIQRRILGRLRNKKRSIKRKIDSRKNLHSYIQLQTTRKLSLFYGNLPITEMHRGTKRTSYIPFLLNPETRSDVIPVRLHFCETIPQARQPISHRRIFVNNGMVNITHFKLSHGDIISFKENDAGEEIGKRIEEIGKRIGKSQNFQLRSAMQEEDLERTKKFGSEKVCLGSYFAEHNRMKRNFYHFKSLFLSNRRNDKNRNIPTRIRSPIVDNSSLYSNSTYCSASPQKLTRKRIIKRIELPTHYSEVNHRTPKAVVSYGPNIGHIPHDIRLKDPNLLLRSGNGRGQNI
uniref:ribosomal protein S4 n=1 Tax=Cuscuta epithymum TaxID=186058 RepID=UPI002062CA17|nr:ribosomal protein S4 [Cuscuta epithymum]WHS15808.1 ribosomal protein S4 [Cuscuta epithymum]DAZ87082.1 TPA_asm: ribosomal protein S4 [Cuscuta epilinum]